MTSALNVYPSRYRATVPASSDIPVAISAIAASRRLSSSAVSASPARMAAAISATARLCHALLM